MIRKEEELRGDDRAADCAQELDPARDKFFGTDGFPFHKSTSRFACWEMPCTWKLHRRLVMTP